MGLQHPLYVVDLRWLTIVGFRSGFVGPLTFGELFNILKRVL